MKPVKKGGHDSLWEDLKGGKTMKKGILLVFVLFLVPSLVFGQGLVTGAKRGFVPGDKVLFEEDFS